MSTTGLDRVKKGKGPLARHDHNEMLFVVVVFQGRQLEQLVGQESSIPMARKLKLTMVALVTILSFLLHGLGVAAAATPSRLAMSEHAVETRAAKIPEHGLEELARMDYKGPHRGPSPGGHS